MRHSPLYLATLLAACGTDPVTSASATETGTGTTTQDGPTTGGPTTTPTATTEDSPTGDSGRRRRGLRLPRPRGPARRRHLRALRSPPSCGSTSPRPTSSSSSADRLRRAVRRTFSMAVDRLGFAWVQYLGGELRKVDVTNVANCTDPGYVPGQTGVSQLRHGLRLQQPVRRLRPHLRQHLQRQAEGNKDRRLLDHRPPTLRPRQARQDQLRRRGHRHRRRPGLPVRRRQPRQAGRGRQGHRHTLSVIPLPGVELGGAFAFAFFAGDFYFFTDSDNDSTSEVTHIDYDDSDNNGKQDLTVVCTTPPCSIVGAGVSTCAPTSRSDPSARGPPDDSGP
jgi:hypothetical protein